MTILPGSNTKPKAKLALIRGHEAKAPGAFAVAPIMTHEYHYCGWLINRAINFAVPMGIHAKEFLRDGRGITGVYDDVRRWFEEYTIDHVACIEVHFNAAAARSARGTETLYCDEKDARGVREKEFATLIQEEMCKALGREGKLNRGLKYRPESSGEAGWYNLNRLVHYPSILIEPFFGSNAEDAELGKRKMDDLALSLVSATHQFWGLGLTAPGPV